MLIREVIRRCDMMSPNEYTDEEKYAWCDDLSAMLRTEHLREYDSAILKRHEYPDDPLRDRTFLLPEGVTSDMIDRIYIGGTEIKKYDMRTYGIKYLYGKRGRIAVPRHILAFGDMKVVYLRPHEPIRTVCVSAPEPFSDGVYDVIAVRSQEFMPGDIVNIVFKINGGDDVSVDGAPVMNVQRGGGIVLPKDETARLLFPGDMFSDMMGKDVTEAVIERVVTDETVCSAPYDLMYTDYVSGMICFGQRDIEMYDQHMNVFNRRLEAYDRYLMMRRTEDGDGRLCGWW